MVAPLLSDNYRKAELSFVYLSALAAVSGYTIQRGPNPDTNSVDAQISAGGDMARQIDVQLKATASPKWGRRGLQFQLKRKNYDDLRAPRAAPGILVVLVLPKDQAEWLSWDENKIAIRRCAWWQSLQDFPEIDTKRKTVVLPQSQALSPDTLKDIMSRVQPGRLSLGGEAQ